MERLFDDLMLTQARAKSHYEAHAPETDRDETGKRVLPVAADRLILIQLHPPARCEKLVRSNKSAEPVSKIACERERRSEGE